MTVHEHQPMRMPDGEIRCAAWPICQLAVARPLDMPDYSGASMSSWTTDLDVVQVETSIDGRRIVGAVLRGVGVIDLGPKPDDPPPDPALVELFRNVKIHRVEVPDATEPPR